MKKYLLFVIILFTLCSCIVPINTNRVLLIHRVQPGDTMSRIYYNYRIPHNCPYTPYRPNNRIYVGEYITVFYPF